MASRSERVEALFHAAVELDGAARRTFLDAACGGDAELRREVESLLVLDQRPAACLDRPAPETLARRDEPASLLVGRRLGSYVLLRRIATGGMGAVYEASQGSPARTVAVKVLRADLATADAEERFRLEAALLARLQHPGIAHVYEAGVADLDGLRVPFIALELVDAARTITEHADAIGLDLHRRIELFVRVCEAVQHGHMRGVLHRDLKPANILVDRDGRPKLIDYGVARALDPEGGTRLTQAGAVIGTVSYMSPEQCADARELDVRSDVYSLGVVLYELLCGCLPHDVDGLSLPEAARVVREREPRRPSAVTPLLRGDLETILLAALERDPARRYPSAIGLAEDLGRYQRGEPIAARAPSVPHRLALFARRHRALVSALLSITAVALAAAVVSLDFALREKGARRDAEHQSYLACIKAADLSLAAYDSRGARRHLEAARPDLRGFEWRHLAARLERAERTFLLPLSSCGTVVWNGEHITASCWDRAAPARRAVVVWEAQSGVEIARASSELGSPAHLVAFGPRRTLWTGDDGALWLSELGAERVEPFDAGHGVAIERLCAGLEGAVAAAYADGLVRTWDRSGARAWELRPEPGEPISALALAPDGQRLALGSESGAIRIATAASPETPHILTGHARRVLAVAFDPTGSTLASGARDGTVRLWDVASGAEARRMYGHESEVTSVAFLESGALLASASHDGTVRVWETSSGACASVLYGHSGWISALAVSRAGDRLASAASDGTVRVWDPRATPGVRRLAPHADIVRDVAFSPDGERLAAASFDGDASLIDVATGAVVARVGSHRSRVQSVAFDPARPHLATGANDHLVRLWDARSGALVREIPGHGDGVHAVAFSRDGKLLASGSKDQRVLVRRGDGLQTVAELAHSAWIEGVAFDRSGARLASVSRDGWLRLWRIADARELWSRRVENGLADVAVSPDGGSIATAGEDGIVRLWSLDSGEPRARFSGHDAGVLAVAFSPDGTRLASASYDATVRLWDLATAQEVLVLRRYSSWVWSVAFAPAGDRLASGGGNYDGTGVEVRIWEAPWTSE